MTDAKRLLTEATPLPWSHWPESEYATGRSLRTSPAQIDSPNGVIFRAYSQASPSDAALIVYAVNHLPDYLAAVEALERLIALTGEWDDAIAGSLWLERIVEARAALRRLRDEVPA